jgi:TatD DNase family protein
MRATCTDTPMSKKRDIPRYGHPILETHCHLDYLKDKPLSDIIADAAAVGVERIITIAVSPANQTSVLEIAEAHDRVWTTQGIHPHEAAAMTPDVAAGIVSRLGHPRVVAIGECGLDYYYEHTDRTTQRTVFEQHLQWSADTGLPLVIHTRDADDDTQAILANFSGRLPRGGVIHSFTSSPGLAEFCLGEGFCLGFNGIATFPKADNVRDVVALTPLDRILLETDAPYLTPVPWRGRENAPAFLPFVAEVIAGVKGCDTPTLLGHAWQNSLRLFFPIDCDAA